MRVPKSLANVQPETLPYSSLNHAALRVRKFIGSIWIDAMALVVIGIVFVVPFVFILLTASKSRAEAALFQFSWPSQFQLSQNIQDVLAFGDNRMFLALKNSMILTVGSVALIVLLSALAAFVMQRRHGRAASVVSSVM